MMGQITGFVSNVEDKGPPSLRWWEVVMRTSGEPDPPDVAYWMNCRVRVSDEFDLVGAGDPPAGRVLADGRGVILIPNIRRALAAAADALAYHSGDATFGEKDREALERVRELQALLGPGED